MSVKCVRLKSGEDIIATVTETLTDYVVKNPIQVGLTQGNNGFSLAMIPFIPFAKDKTLVIPKASVLFVFDPETDLHNQYAQIHGGILRPDAPTVERPKLHLVD